MDLNDFREDPEKQNGGAPIYIGDATFFGKRCGTPESTKAFRDLRMELFGPLHKYQDGDEQLLIAHWLYEFGITKWEGVFLGEKELEFSKSNARKVFLNPEYRLSLNIEIYDKLNRFENFLYDQIEGDTETLKKS